MFHSDISFTSKEKAEQFGEDAKNFLINYKDAIDFVKEKAYNDQAKDHYLDNAKSIISGFKGNMITFSKFLGSSSETTFVPTFNRDDEKFKLAKYTYFLHKEHFGHVKKAESFEALSKELDTLAEVLEKQSSI